MARKDPPEDEPRPLPFDAAPPWRSELTKDLRYDLR